MSGFGPTSWSSFRRVFKKSHAVSEVSRGQHFGSSASTQRKMWRRNFSRPRFSTAVCSSVFISFSFSSSFSSSIYDEEDKDDEDYYRKNVRPITPLTATRAPMSERRPIFSPSTRRVIGSSTNGEVAR